VKRHREPRPKLATTLPRDDGPREGTDAWREVGGVEFCHWDRWLLRLALDEPEGLRTIAREFRRRAASARGGDGVAEAMLAQVADLEARLARLGLTPDAVLDEVERASKWLHDKAFRRVWHATSIRPTGAMQCTPRKVLEERALCGNWSAFAVSPARYAGELKAAVGDGWYDYRGTGLVVLLLHTACERVLWTAKGDDDRLAIHRAMLTVAIGAMEQVDDSLDELGQHFREHEHAYLELLGPRIERPGLLRDLLELVVWEDFGLFSEVEQFLAALPEVHADLAMRELARIVAELRGATLERQLAKARSLRRVLLTAAEALPPETGLEAEG